MILFITGRTLDALLIQVFSEMCFRKIFSIVSIDGCSNGDHCNSQLLYPYLVSNIFEKILATMMIGCLLRTLWLQTV